MFPSIKLPYQLQINLLSYLCCLGEAHTFLSSLKVRWLLLPPTHLPTRVVTTFYIHSQCTSLVTQSNKWNHFVWHHNNCRIANSTKAHTGSRYFQRIIHAINKVIFENLLDFNFMNSNTVFGSTKVDAMKQQPTSYFLECPQNRPQPQLRQSFAISWVNVLLAIGMQSRNTGFIDSSI